MSSQRGNVSRTRPPKHRNVTVFKNNLYDTSKKIKVLNSLQFDNVCVKCRAILEWKVKYKKYKTIKAAKTCCKCNEKTIKEAYHIMCEKCASVEKVCPKCGNNKKNSEINDQSVSNQFNELVLEKSKASKQESSDESYDRETSSDCDNDSESLISSDCDAFTTCNRKPK